MMGAAIAGVVGLELEAFTVEWQTRGRLEFTHGSRRVFASGEAEAIRRGREIIAGEQLLRLDQVAIVRVTRAS